VLSRPNRSIQIFFWEGAESPISAPFVFWRFTRKDQDRPIVKLIVANSASSPFVDMASTRQRSKMRHPRQTVAWITES